MSERSNDWLAQTEIDLLRAERDELYQAMNVSNHRDALAKLRSLHEENERLRAAVLNQCGDNLCWVIDPDAVKALPQAEFLESCRRYHAQLVAERGEASGLLTIAQLEAEVAVLAGRLRAVQEEAGSWSADNLARLVDQAHAVNHILSEAKVGACSIPEGVRILLHRAEVAEARLRAVEAQQAEQTNPPCALCGGPHPFDTSIPSVVWNSVIRAAGLPEYLCLTCIVGVFAQRGESFTAELYGAAFDGDPIEVRVNGVIAQDAQRLSDENNRLRTALREAGVDPVALLPAAGVVPSPPPEGTPATEPLV